MITVQDKLFVKSQIPCVMIPLYDDLCSILSLRNERWPVVMSKTLATIDSGPGNLSAL